MPAVTIGGHQHVGEQGRREPCSIAGGRGASPRLTTAALGTDRMTRVDVSCRSAVCAWTRPLAHQGKAHDISEHGIAWGICRKKPQVDELGNATSSNLGDLSARYVGPGQASWGGSILFVTDPRLVLDLQIDDGASDLK